MEPLHDSIRLRALGLGARVVDILDGEIELVFMVLGIAAIFRAPVGQHAAQLHLVAVIEGHDAVVEKVGGGDRRLSVIELGESHLGVGVDEGLLIDAPDALHVADVEGVLRAAIARALALELAMRFLLGLGLLQGRQLALGQHQALLRDFRLKRLQPLLHGLQIMALPDPAHAGR